MASGVLIAMEIIGIRGSRAGVRSGTSESLFVAAKFGEQISADVTEKKQRSIVRHKTPGAKAVRSDIAPDLSPDEKQA
jgi:hypothetical protein